jgi:ketosteroid isomerase-like protein
MSSADPVSESTEVAQLARQFIEALNARDLETVRSLIDEDTEFRTRGRATLYGYDGARDVVTAAEDTDLRLVIDGEPTQERVDDDRTRVAVPVGVLVHNDRIGGTAEFEIRDRKIVAFEILTALANQ